jgi:hypothetical protein
MILGGVLLIFIDIYYDCGQKWTTFMRNYINLPYQHAPIVHSVHVRRGRGLKASLKDRNVQGRINGNRS